MRHERGNGARRDGSQPPRRRRRRRRRSRRSRRPPRRRRSSLGARNPRRASRPRRRRRRRRLRVVVVRVLLARERVTPTQRRGSQRRRVPPRLPAHAEEEPKSKRSVYRFVRSRGEPGGEGDADAMNAVEEREEGLDVSRKRRRRRRRRLCRIAVVVASGAVFVVASQYLVAQNAEGHLEQHRVGRALAEEVDEGVGGGGAVGVVGADGGAVVRSSGAREVTLRRGRSAGRGKEGRSQRGGRREAGAREGGSLSARRTGERRGARRAPGVRAALTFRYLRTNRIAYSSTVGSLAAISSRAGRCASSVCLVPTNQRPRGGTAVDPAC